MPNKWNNLAHQFRIPIPRNAQMNVKAPLLNRYLWTTRHSFLFFSFQTLSDNAIDRLSTLPPSTTGSLSSITTTSVASSEPGDSSTLGGDENHRHKHNVGANGRHGGRGGGGGGGGHGSRGGGDVEDDILAEKLAHKNAMPLKQEKWYQTTLQVSIPFFLAGIGTIGAGIILGRVEVSANTIRSFSSLLPGESDTDKDPTNSTIRGY